MALTGPIISAISLAISLSVAWLTLFRRGNLYMTRPVQIAFVFENVKPKIFLRTLLYSTGKRGYVIEGLYVKVRCGDANQTFGFWGYGERNELMSAGGMRIGEDGVAYNHHFLQINPEGSFQFLAGEYEINVYARIINRRSARLLSRSTLTLSQEHAALMLDKTCGVLFTWDPDSQQYNPEVSERRPQFAGASG